MLKIIVGSKNPVKTKCVENVFSKYFKDVEVIAESVNSFVSEQPFSEQETLLGAKNRAKEVFVKNNPDFGIGIEGGLEEIENKLYAFAWICIRAKDGRIGLGKTASFPLPKRIEELIREGIELGEADDIIFKRKNSKQKTGAIGLLSKEVLGRVELYEHGVISALLPFLNKDLYFI